jgi:hypothetical protein
VCAFDIVCSTIASIYQVIAVALRGVWGVPLYFFVCLYLYMYMKPVFEQNREPFEGF